MPLRLLADLEAPPLRPRVPVRLPLPVVPEEQHPPAEPGLQQPRDQHLLEPEPLVPPTAVKSEPAPMDPAPTCTTPAEEWTSTMGSTEAEASG
jgi:hypothetical protein